MEIEAPTQAQCIQKPLYKRHTPTIRSDSHNPRYYTLRHHPLPLPLLEHAIDYSPSLESLPSFHASSPFLLILGGYHFALENWRSFAYCFSEPDSLPLSLPGLLLSEYVHLHPGDLTGLVRASQPLAFQPCLQALMVADVRLVYCVNLQSPEARSDMVGDLLKRYPRKKSV